MGLAETLLSFGDDGSSSSESELSAGDGAPVVDGLLPGESGFSVPSSGSSESKIMASDLALDFRGFLVTCVSPALAVLLARLRTAFLRAGPSLAGSGG